MSSGSRMRNGKYKGLPLFFLAQLQRWCARVAEHPRLCIILPLLITLLLSYPSRAVLNDPKSVFKSLVSENYVSKMEIISFDESRTVDSDLDLQLLQVWVKTNDDTNFLRKQTLLESLAFQTRLFKNTTEVSTISSPFCIWYNSLNILKNDPSPLRTINDNYVRIPRYSFFGSWKVNGVLTSATGFVISALLDTEKYSKLMSPFNENMNQLEKIANITGFHILSDARSQTDAKNTELLKYTMVFCSKWDDYLLIASALLFITYFVLSVRKLRSGVKSIIGISIAMILTLILAISSASIITTFWFKNGNDNIPFHLFYLPISFALISGQLKAVKDVSGSSLGSTTAKAKLDGHKGVAEAYDNSQDKDFIFAISESHYQFTKSLIVLSLAIFAAVPFSEKAVCFLLISLLIGIFLHCSFFTAVMSLDLRRFDSDDYLSATTNASLFLDEDIVTSNGFRSKLKDLLSVERLCSGVTINLFCLVYMYCFSTRFFAAQTLRSLFKRAPGSVTSSFTSGKIHTPKVVFDNRLLAHSNPYPILSQQLGGKSDIVLRVAKPIIVVKSGEQGNLIHDSVDIGKLFEASLFISSYKVDFYYAIKFVLFVALTISCALLLLQKVMFKLDTLGSFKRPQLHERQDMKELQDKKDKEAAVEESSNKLDDQDTLMRQFHVKELYNQGHTLDITNISESNSPFVVSVGLDYNVFVWSPLVKPIPAPTSIPLSRKFWPLSKVIVSNDGYFIAFFSKCGNITVWSRRQMKFIWELKLKQNSAKNNAVPLEAFFRRITIPSFKKNKPQSTLSRQVSKHSPANINSAEFVTVTALGGIDTSYENMRSTSTADEQSDELVFVTAAGLIHSVNSQGTIRVDHATSLKNPLASCKKLSSPRVNDRLVICDEAGDLYVSTVVNNKWRSRKLTVNYRNVITPPERSCKIKHLTDGNSGYTTTSQDLSTMDHTIELVPFVGMLVRVLGTNAELIDAQTGTLIRTVSLGYMKQNSLQVFHDTPTHCRFCGSASVASFSMAYTDQDSSRVVLHTFRLESKTKTSICLRVERDPREIRCLGMESAAETIHYFYNIENWCVTDNNMIIGIRRVPENIVDKIGTSSMSRNDQNDSVSLLNRKSRAIDSSSNDSSSYQIHNIWEGWTMSANGTVMLHKIPVGVNGLVVNKIGPLVRFGAKAMIVGFANIMNMFYIGHEDMLFITENENSNREESSLKFVNKRRDRFSHRKVPVNYSAS